jgi:glycosyltransferase 2 family protein
VRLPGPQSTWLRSVLIAIPLAGAGFLIWWRGPEWALVRDAFTVVRWRWVFAAIGLNLLSVLARAIAWDVAIREALIPGPAPRFRSVFSAFGVGLFANAVLPGRIGELARVAVLARKMPDRPGVWPTLVGSVFAHRTFDLFPTVALIVWVLLTAKIPHWALTSLGVVVAIGFVLFAIALAGARRHHRPMLDELGTVRRLALRARRGLAVMRRPWPAALAIFFQTMGWLCQLLAVYTTMLAFHIHVPLPAAGLVLLLMNVATIFPLWPGNIGLVQAAVAFPLVSYGVAYSTGFAYGIALQAVELSVAVSCGLVSLAVEGITFATLRRMPDASGSLEDDDDERTAATPAEADEDEERAPEAGRTRAGAGVSR